MTLRSNLFAALRGFAMLSALATAPGSAWAVTTVSNEHVLVQDSVVRLGDLFEGLDGNTRQPVGQAPAPGDRMVYDIAKLAAVARANDIDWRPRTWSDRVVVERTSQKIGQQAIEAALSTEVQRRGINRKRQIEVTNRNLELVLPSGVPATLTVEQFDFDERGGRFSAVVAAPADAPTTRVAVQGRVHDLVEVPVLSRRFNTGEIIHQDDIDWVSLRSDQVNRNILTDANRLIGQEVRRGTNAGQPVRSSDLRAPLIVSKGSLVTMVLQTPKMQLTSKGRAMDDASMGEVVRIMNIQSKTVVEATVVGANTVHVMPAAAMRY